VLHRNGRDRESAGIIFKRVVLRGRVVPVSYFRHSVRGTAGSVSYAVYGRSPYVQIFNTTQFHGVPRGAYRLRRYEFNIARSRVFPVYPAALRFIARFGLGE